MGAEENYLDKLLKSITEPKNGDETEAEETMSLVDETGEELVSGTEEPVPAAEETASGEPEVTVVIESLDEPEVSDIPEENSETETASAEQVTDEADIETELELGEIDDLEAVETPDIELAEDGLESELNMAEIGELEMTDELSIDDIDAAVSDELSIGDVDLSSDELSIDDIDAAVSDELNIEEPETAASEELTLEEIEPETVEDTAPEETDASASEEVTVEEAEAEPETAEELNLEETEPEVSASEEVTVEEAEAEPETAEELNLEEAEPEIEEEISLEEAEPEALEDLRLGELDLEASDDDMGVLEGLDAIESETPGVDGELEDVLSMLDDDADLAEINDILKKSDSKEPIQDEMMDLLNQMADDEAELVNAGVKDIVEDDGVPLPEMPVIKQMPANPDVPENKEKAKKKKKDNEDKAPGAVGKFLNMLTEDLPGPTEEDYAAEDEAKAAKKQENKEKKEQEKVAKDEEKKAKAEEKAAAKKAKADAAAQKKKEKEAAKAEKAAAKKAKQQAEAIKRAKRIPPKKIIAVAAFGASVLGAVVVSTTILSNQGYVNVARKAFYDGDYKNVYLSTYGMELNDSDGLIQARSEVIMKMQCWYDSYQNNLKLNRQREALDALLHGIEAYDNINADAEQYGVLTEVDGIRNTILNVLETRYGVSEAQARELLNYEDALAYTIALNDIITGE